MASSPIYDVITPVLMTSYDLIQVDMIILTPFYDPAKFHLKWDIFQLSGPIPRSREFFNSSLQDHKTAVYRVTIQSNVILVEGAKGHHPLPGSHYFVL